MDIDPEIRLIQAIGAELQRYGPKTAAKVALTIESVLMESEGVSLQARLRACVWAVDRTQAAADEEAERAAKGKASRSEAEEDEATDYENPSVEAERLAAMGVDPPKGD